MGSLGWVCFLFSDWSRATKLRNCCRRSHRFICRLTPEPELKSVAHVGAALASTGLRERLRRPGAPANGLLPWKPTHTQQASHEAPQQLQHASALEGDSLLGPPRAWHAAAPRLPRARATLWASFSACPPGASRSPGSARVPSHRGVFTLPIVIS